MKESKSMLKESITFVVFLVAASAMDSERVLIPAALCIASALILYRMSGKTKKNPHADRESKWG